MYPATIEELRAYYSRAALFLIVYTTLSQLALLAVYLPLYFGAYGLFWNEWYQNGISAMVYYPSGVLAALLVLRGLPETRVLPGPRPGAPSLLRWMSLGLGMIYIGSFFTQYLLADTDTVNYASEAIEAQPMACTIVYVVLAAPVMEELIFRRLVLDRLLVLGDWSAVGLSALFFGLFHTNFYQFLYATIAGLLLGYLRIMTGGVRWCILLHMFINFFSSVILPAAGDDTEAGVLLSLLVLFSIGYTLYYLLRYRPWRSFSPGPTGCTFGEKLIGLVTSPVMWLCVVFHLCLSAYYISA